jgi:hypothetical protein
MLHEVGHHTAVVAGPSLVGNSPDVPPAFFGLDSQASLICLSLAMQKASECSIFGVQLNPLVVAEGTLGVGDFHCMIRGLRTNTLMHADLRERKRGYSE